MSARTVSTAVSVEWLTLYADWRSGSRSLSLRYFTSCFETTRSSNLKITDKFEIGRYDLTSAGSKSVFFYNDVTFADLNLDGTTPCSSDLLSQRHKNGARSSTFAFRSHVGYGSDEHCLSGRDRTIAIASACVTDNKTGSSQWAGSDVKFGGSASAVAARNDTCLLYYIIEIVVFKLR